jgi:hypothetical protein
MIKEAIEKILDLAPFENKTISFNNRIYAARTPIRLKRPEEFEPDALELSTLQGIVEFVQQCAGVDIPAKTELGIFVVNESKVNLVGCLQPDNDNLRFCYLESELAHAPFAFGRWLSQEEFIIGLNSLFVPDEMRNKVLQLVSHMIDDEGIEYRDDGIGQTVTVRTGVHMAGEQTVPPTIRLVPYRTFREVPQPASDFCLRVRQKPLKLALFEADGGIWKDRAVENIKHYFANALPDVAVWG